MRFYVHALHAPCSEHTNHKVTMSRYSAVHIASDQVSGAVHFIKACTVCEFLPFRHNCSQVTETGLR